MKLWDAEDMVEMTAQLIPSASSKTNPGRPSTCSASEHLCCLVSVTV